MNRYTECPTTYQTRHFFSNSTTNEDIATKQTHTTDTFVFISHTTNVILFKTRCNIFIGFRIIKEMPGSVGSGTPCVYLQWMRNQENRKIYGRNEKFNQVLTPAFKSNRKRTNIEKNEEKNTEKVTSSFTMSQLRYNTAKTKFPGSRLVFSGVLRSKDVNWRRVGAAKDRL